MAPSKCEAVNCKGAVFRVTDLRDKVIPLDAKPFAVTGAAPPKSLAGLYVIASDDRCHAAEADLDLIANGKLAKPVYISHWTSCKDRDNWRGRVPVVPAKAKK